VAKPTIALFTTYPIVAPRHGGQLRARALVRAYEAAGFVVTPVAVVEKGAWKREVLGPNDLEFPVDDPRWFISGENVPLCADLRSGLFAATSEEAYEQLCSRLPSRIDVIHLEQPWLLPVAERLMKARAASKAVLVYGSQNIEAPLREAIFRQLAITKGATEVVERILALEVRTAQLAQLTLAVAPHDEAVLQKLGAKKVVRASNGIDGWKASKKAIEYWRGKLPYRRFALFIGSGHPPNFDGFFRAFGDALGFVPPDCKIVIAGSVSPPIFDHYHRSRFNTLNLSRLEILGELEDDDLSALKTLTSVFLLPIFEGGGSNIKTAEAIYSGKKVIATSTSLRGYDAQAKLPEIVVADTQEQFRVALRRALSPAPGDDRSVEPARAPRDNLLWTNCLSAVAPAVNELLTRR